MAEITIQDLEGEYRQALTYRQPWDTEWRKITDYLLPGRGIYQTYSKPQPRKLISPKVINPIARDALQVLTAGFHGGLTSPSRPWFDLTFSDSNLNNIKPLKQWLDACKKVLYTCFEQSNFYQTVHSFYTEFGGFGNSAMYCGEDSKKPFRFELLTVGEYAFSTNAEGNIDKFFRSIFKTNRQLIEQFGIENVSDTVKRAVEKTPDDYVALTQAVVPLEYMDKPYTSVYWENGQQTFLRRAGFYEFPYLVGRWDIIGSDIYGLGLGSYALPDIQRLQEMEKAFLMGAHKSVDPPLNAPARKKGKVKTLPGGITYYSNPNEVVKSLYDIRIDWNGVLEAMGRCENRIRQTFFNDLFITASRDPNASPMKAAEVYEKKDEKLIRIGPVIERVLHEFVSPMIERCFNIAARKRLLPQLDPRYAAMVSDYSISFVSPLAQSQKLIASQPINTFLQFMTGAAQFNPEVVDKVDTDKLVDEYADVTGVPQIILRDQTAVDKIRNDRRKLQAQEKAKAEAAMNAQLRSQMAESQSTVARNYSEAGVNLGEALPQPGGI